MIQRNMVSHWDVGLDNGSWLADSTGHGTAFGGTWTYNVRYAGVGREIGRASNCTRQGKGAN